MGEGLREVAERLAGRADLLRIARACRTSRSRAFRVLLVSGTMKSITSPTASAPWNRVSRMLVEDTTPLRLRTRWPTRATVTGPHRRGSGASFQRDAFRRTGLPRDVVTSAAGAVTG